MPIFSTNFHIRLSNGEEAASEVDVYAVVDEYDGGGVDRYGTDKVPYCSRIETRHRWVERYVWGVCVWV